MKTTHWAACPLAFAVLATLTLPTAHADVWSNYSNSYSDYVTSWTKYHAGDASDAQKNMAQLSEQSTALDTQQAKEQQELSQAQTVVVSLQTTQSAIEGEIEGLQKTTPPKDGEILGMIPLKSDQEKALRDAQKRAAKVQKDLTDEQSRLQSAQSQLAKTNQDIQQNQTQAAKAQAVVQRKNQALADTKTPAWQADAARVEANELFLTQKQNGFDAKLLLTDLTSVQSQNKLSQIQVNALKKSWDTQLNNTLMGQYVNQQIKKAMATVCDPEFQSACAAGKADALNSLLNTRLNAAKAADSPDAGGETSTDATVKGVEAPGTNSGSGPVNSNSGTVH